MDTPSYRLNPSVLWTVAIGAALTALCVLFYLVNPPFIALLNNKVTDAIVVRHAGGASDTRVVVVDIDEKTLDT